MSTEKKTVFVKQNLNNWDSNGELFNIISKSKTGKSAEQAYAIRTGNFEIDYSLYINSDGKKYISSTFVDNERMMKYLKHEVIPALIDTIGEGYELLDENIKIKTFIVQRGNTGKQIDEYLESKLLIKGKSSYKYTVTVGDFKDGERARLIVSTVYLYEREGVHKATFTVRIELPMEQEVKVEPMKCRYDISEDLNDLIEFD